MSCLRLRREVFSHGIVSVDLLHLHEANLTGVAQQLSLAILSHSSGTTAAIPFTQWCNQAQELFRSTEIVARLYFETFLAVHNKNVHRHGAPRLLLSADLGEFLLFLYLQKCRAGNQSHHSTTHTSPTNRHVNEAHIRHQSPQEFIINNLNTILSLIRDPHKHVHDISMPVSPHSAHSPLTPPRSPIHNHHSTQMHHSNSHLCLEPHEFNRLGFLFYAHDAKIERAEHLELVTENQDINPPEQRNEVMNLAAMTPFFNGTGEQAVPIALVQEWLIRHLTETESDLSNSYARPTLSHGHLIYPPSVKFSDITNVREHRVTLTSSDLEGGDLHISNCSDCHIDVLTHCRYAVIEDVHNAVIQCGTVGSFLIVRRCSSLTLTVACRVVHFADVRHMRVYLFSAMRPIILGTMNTDICLAPYNTYYPDLNSDIAATGMTPSTNCWSSPVIVSHASGSTSAQLLHSPLRGSRGLNGGNLSVIQSPPPPSSPRRSSSPSPLLSPHSQNASPPVSVSPKRSSSGHPISPSSATSPADRSPTNSLLSPVMHDRRRAMERGRARGKSMGSVREIHRAHRMSDEDDSGSEYSTDDERNTLPEGTSRAQSKHSSVQSNSGSPQSSHGLRFHSSSASVSQSPTGLHSPEERSSGHSSPASTSPPFGPQSLTVGVNAFASHLSPNLPHSSLSHSLSPSSNASPFFPSTPSPTSVPVNGVVSLLAPDLFFLVEGSDVRRDVSPHDSSSAASSGPVDQSITTTNPFPLPSVYTDFLQERTHRAKRVRELIDSAQLNEQEQSVLFESMKQHFQSWLSNAVPQAQQYLTSGAQTATDANGQSVLSTHEFSEDMKVVRDI